jgi:hypothetical protein
LIIAHEAQSRFDSDVETARIIAGGGIGRIAESIQGALLYSEVKQLVRLGMKKSRTNTIGIWFEHFSYDQHDRFWVEVKTGAGYA